MSDENTEWLDDLVDQLEDKILEVARFKTHRQRKGFLGEIKSLIKESVAKNTNPKTTGNPLVITKPNPNKAAGFAVMTEGRSGRGDDITKSVNAAKEAEREPKGSANRSGVNSW